MAGYYHLEVKTVSRGKGQAVVACAAYRSGTMLRDERYGKTHDFRRRQGILETGIALPTIAPTWMTSREQLWNYVEAGEKRKDARLAREFEIAFADKFNAAQRLELLDEFIRTEITSRGLAADWVIHEPNRKGDQRNFHAHVLVPDRPVAATGFARLKDRRLNDDENVVNWRAAWADIQNRAFERLGICDQDGSIMRVDHRSYKGQGIDRDPTQHMGHLATAMERRGTQTDIGDKNREIQRANERRQTLVRTRPGQELSRQELELDRPNPDRPERYRPNRGRRDRDRGDYER